MRNFFSEITMTKILVKPKKQAQVAPIPLTLLGVTQLTSGCGRTSPRKGPLYAESDGFSCWMPQWLKSPPSLSQSLCHQLRKAYLHLTTTFNITAKEARQYVNRHISIDARTGKIAFDHQTKERIIKHTHWLYQGDMERI